MAAVQYAKHNLKSSKIYDVKLGYLVQTCRIKKPSLEIINKVKCMMYVCMYFIYNKITLSAKQRTRNMRKMRALDALNDSRSVEGQAHIAGADVRVY